MKTEIFIEGRPLDVSKESPSLITFGVDEIKDFAQRSTAGSKTIVLPGTSNNNKLLGHIFDIGHSNFHNPELPNVGYNFNASKGAECVIFQDNIQTFKGVLRLLKILSFKGQIEYEVAVFGELNGLNSALSSRKLEDLDFSAHNHVYNHTNIVNSWDNTPGSGYYYPLIDYGNYSVLKHNWDIRTFRPALYVKEYIDKMFEASNFRYQSDFFNTDFFKSLIIPCNTKFLYRELGTLLQVSNSTPVTINGPLIYRGLSFPNAELLGDFTTSDDIEFSYGGSLPYTPTIEVTISGTYRINNPVQYVFYVLKYQGGTWSTDDALDLMLLPSTGGATVPFTVTKSIPIELNALDQIAIQGILGATDSPNYEINITSSTLKIEAPSTQLVQVSQGETVKVNFNIPKNVKQIDFLKSIVQMFNLYIIEDRFESGLFHITPYVDFYSTDPAEAIDWSYKLDRDKLIEITPMSELNAKIYEFKFKADSDFYSELYRKRYGEGYGDYTFDSEFEFSENKQSLEVIFSSTPLIGVLGEDKIFPTIYKRSGNGEDVQEEPIDSNIRIMLSKKITGVTSWNIIDQLNGDTALTTLTSYGYAGHLDDPDAPNIDLNFGALKEVFFALASGNLSNTTFNRFWDTYMAEVTDKDSKLLTASFYLTPKDIYSLDFSKHIYLDGYFFKINSIKDYNASNPSDCKVELLKTNYLYTEYIPPEVPVEDTTPDAFSFTPVSDATISTPYTSESITPTGFDTPTDIVVVNGEYSINGGAFTSEPGTFSPGSSVELKATSSSGYEATTTATLTIGGVSADFLITTMADPTIITLGITVSNATDSSVGVRVDADEDAVFNETVQPGQLTQSYTVANNENVLQLQITNNNDEVISYEVVQQGGSTLHSGTISAGGSIMHLIQKVTVTIYID